MENILATPLIAIVLIIGILVFVHEFGHFIVGRACGIGVETFSIGVGPRLVSFKYKQTLYKIAWIPLGGYVKFAGALPTEEVHPEFLGKEYFRAGKLSRAMTMFAGPFANFLLAIFAFTFIGYKGIEHPAPIIGELRRGGPAEKAGLLPGDEILRIEDKDVKTWQDVQKIILAGGGKELPFKLKRQNDTIQLLITPEPTEIEDYLGKKQIQGRAGFSLGLLPPSVTVLSDKSPAFLGGVKNGDRVEKIQVLDKEFPLKTWFDLLQALWEANKVKASKLTFHTISLEQQTFGQGKKSDPKPTLSKEIQLPIAFQNRTFINNPPHLSDFDQLASDLGVMDSQLTIAELKPEEGDEKGIQADMSPSKLQAGDHLMKFNEEPIRDIFDLQEKLSKNHQPEAVITVSQMGVEKEVKETLRPIELQKASGKETFYGLYGTFFGASIQAPPYLEIYPSFFAALQFGMKTTIETSMNLTKDVIGLFTGEVPLKSLGGPMLIAKVAGDSVKLGFQAVLTSLALISINLGVVNLLPIPLLDGGQLVLVGWEAIRRKPLSEQAIENYQKIGFIMVMSLVVLATYNDLSRFWASMLREVIQWVRP